MAEDIRAERVASVNDPSMERVTYRPIGEQWVHRFIQRHPQLKSVLGRTIEAARIKEASKDSINRWFDKVVETMEKHQITIENVYNMDETGTALGTVEASRVIIDATLRTKYQAQPGRQEWVSVVEYICADGTVIPPLVIFKGENL
jgi:Holliday junction resolvasome RuvABC endonuclease subunit